MVYLSKMVTFYSYVSHDQIHRGPMRSCLVLPAGFATGSSCSGNILKRKNHLFFAYQKWGHPIVNWLTSPFFKGIVCVYYIYIYMVPPPKTDVFEVATLLGQITMFSLSSSGGYHIYIYIFIYTHVCINCCLTVEPRYLEQFCHQKRLQTFANESRGPST